MTKDTETGPVRRKIRASAPRAAGAVDARASRVWQQAGARALKAAVGMNVQVTGVDARLVAPDDLPGLPEEGDLIALIENDAGHFGLALVSTALLVSVVEMQTIGKVTDRSFKARTPTPVDGALIGPAIDRLLSGADAALAAAGTRDPATEYRYATLAEAGAPPTLALADVPHKALALEFRIDGGSRTGAMRFVTPEIAVPAAEGKTERADWSKKIGEAVLASDLSLDARLGRVQMPIEQVLALSAGDTVAISRDDLQRIRLVGGSGHMLATARLGQSGGFRAVKLSIAAPGADPTGWSQAGADPPDPG